MHSSTLLHPPRKRTKSCRNGEKSAITSDCHHSIKSTWRAFQNCVLCRSTSEERGNCSRESSGPMTACVDLCCETGAPMRSLSRHAKESLADVTSYRVLFLFLRNRERKNAKRRLPGLIDLRLLRGRCRILPHTVISRLSTVSPLLDAALSREHQRHEQTRAAGCRDYP